VVELAHYNPEIVSVGQNFAQGGKNIIIVQSQGVCKLCSLFQTHLCRLY